MLPLEDPYLRLFVTANVNHGDVVLGISHTGQNAMVVEAVRTSRDKGAHTVALTNYPQSPLARASAFCLTTAYREHRINAAVSCSIIAQMAVVESLYFIVGSWGKPQRPQDRGRSGSTGAAGAAQFERKVRGAAVMYTRYYDPEIFQHALDGMDRSNQIIATYCMDDEMPGWDFVDHFALIQEAALEGSTGTWERVAEETDEVRRRLSGKLVGYYEIPSDSPSRRRAVVQLAFPIDAWTDNVAMMLLSIAGNCFAFCPKIRLLDVALPSDLLASFKGPKFGIPGVRESTGVAGRPLSLHIIKPKMGMTPRPGRPAVLPDGPRRRGHDERRRDDQRRLQLHL